MDRILTSFEIKSHAGDNGEFVGYGAAFGNIDAGKDLIEKGAFNDNMMEHKAAGTMPGMFWAHDGKEPVGEWKSWTTDDKGLLMEGKIWIGKGIPRAEQAYALLKSNGPKGLSIGFKVRDGGDRYEQKTKARILSKLTVGEVSIVPFPMNSKANIISVKSELNDLSFKNVDGTLKTIRELESILRDGGLSDREAKALLAGGYSKAVAPRDAVFSSDILDTIRKYV
jgi:HK97 family phage prohead protease